MLSIPAAFSCRLVNTFKAVFTVCLIAGSLAGSAQGGLISNTSKNPFSEYKRTIADVKTLGKVVVYWGCC